MSDNVRRCPRCGAKVLATDKYCRKCNAPLSSGRVEVLSRDPRNQPVEGMGGLPRPIRPTQTQRPAVEDETVLEKGLGRETGAVQANRARPAAQGGRSSYGSSSQPRVVNTARGPGYEPPSPQRNNRRLWGIAVIIAVIIVIVIVAIVLVIRLNRPAGPETSEAFSTPAVETTPEGVPRPESTAEPTATPRPTPTATPSVTPTPSATPTATPQTMQTVYVTGNNVNVRSGPATTYDSIGTVNAGTALQRFSTENGWSRVSFQGGEGYIIDTYISTTPPNSTATPAPSGTPENFNVTAASGTVTVTSASGANLRKGPGTQYDVAAGVAYNTQLTRTGTTGSWTRVNYNGQELYIFNDLISEGGAQATASPAPGGFNVTPASGTVTVTAEGGAYLRSGPGTSYSQVGSVAKNTQLTRTGTTGDWTRVSYNGQDCFIATYLLSDGSSSTGSQVQADSGTFTVTGNQVNIRSGPGTSFDSLGTVNAGTQLTVTGRSGEWYQVSYNGGTGYISGTYGTKS